MRLKRAFIGGRISMFCRQAPISKWLEIIGHKCSEDIGETQHKLR